MKTNYNRVVQLVFVITAVVLFALTSCNKRQSSNTGTKDLEQIKTVKFGMLPYADHCYAIIGAEQGWFKEVGIDLQYEPIKVEEIVPSLKNHTRDVVSCPPGILFSSYDNATNLCSFVFGDLFQGYALMAQPNAGYKSYADFVKEGLNPDEAIAATVGQLKSKVFAYPAETAIKPFIDLMLQRGKLTPEDFRPLVLDDPLTVNAMRNKQADFQVGGVPSRITLQKEGFTPLLSSIDIAKLARPSADSPELASVMQNGWATTKDFFQNEHASILRLASVNYRIMKFMQADRKKALQIHMAYLSRITGQQFTEADGEIIYDDLDPFVTFENQKPWFHSDDNPLFYKYVNGSILKSFVDQRIYKNKPPTVEDVIFADDVYNELEKLQVESKDLFAKIEQSNIIQLNQSVKEQYDRAKHFYEIYDFYDSARLAKDILERSK